MGSRILPFILSGAFCALAHAEDPLDGIKKIANERIGDRAQISAVLGECVDVIGRLPKRTEPNFNEEFRKTLKAKKDHPNFQQIVGILAEAYKVVAPNPDEWVEPEAPGKEEEKQEEEEGKKEGDKKEEPVVRPASPVTQPTEGSRPGWEHRKESAKIRRELEPEDPDAQSEYGEVEFYSRDYERALDGFGSAIRSGDTRPKTLLYYGRSAYQLGDFELAAQSFAIAQRMGDPQAADLYKLVAGRSSRAKFDSALAAAGLRAPGSASSPQPQPELASAAPPAGAYVSQGAGMTAAEIAAAAARQAEAAPSKIQQSSSITRQAASALRVRDYSAAHALSSQAIDFNPRNAQAWNYRAIAGSKLGRYAEAVYDSSFALGLAPDNAAALQTRSWAFSKQRKYKEGLADANLTLENDPSSSFAYQNRAFALAGMGDRQGVLDSLRRSAQINPQFQPKYEEALQVPEGSDLLFLFEEESGTKAALPAEAAAPAPAPQPGARNKRFLRLVLLSLSGGLLVALGLLHIVSASWREKVRHTMRRVLGGAEGSPVAEGQELLCGFWAQYQPIREIGTGGMGVVYEALDRSLDRRVAIKKMRDEIRLDPAERQRFILEARTVAALHHPNIVDIYSIVEDGQDVYLVFEYVPGRTLFELMREKGPMDFDQARAILRGACEAVEHAHRQKIVHRDIKPSNIMISEEEVVKVMDFGVARQAKEAITKMAMTNTIVGTPPYMAPEQEQGTVRKESDVFALGVCLYEMLCGQLPFTGQGAGMLLNKINARHVPLSQQVKYGLPKGLDEVMAKALAPDPEKRYRTPSEFLAALEAVAAARLA